MDFSAQPEPEKVDAHIAAVLVCGTLSSTPMFKPAHYRYNEAQCEYGRSPK